MASYPKLSEIVLRNACDIVAATDSGLSGSMISRFLRMVNIEEVCPQNMMVNKRTKLYEALANSQKKYNCSNNVLDFFQRVMDPVNYTDNVSLFKDWQGKLNAIFRFDGLAIGDDGKFHVTEKASKISDVKVRADNLKTELTERKSHHQIFNYCKEELLQNNYFHAVFEANKGLFQRIRDLSGLTTDGNRLIEEAFSSNNPILIINNFITQSEKDEHIGVANLLQGLCGMFRNPSAHEPKIGWPITEQDALEILGIISYVHRRLDKVQRIR